MRDAGLQREATAVTAKPALSMLNETAVWYLVWLCGRAGVCLVVGQAMPWMSGKAQSEKIGSEKLCKKAQFGLQSRRPFSTDESDCVRNCLRKSDMGFGLKRLFSTDIYDCVRIGLKKKKIFNISQSGTRLSRTFAVVFFFL